MIDGGLRPLFRKHLPHGFWVSIESGSTAAGIPDSYFCFSYRACGWIEFKSVRANAVRISPLQVVWHEQHARVGGRSFVAVRRDGELILYSGGDARRLLTGGVRGARPMGRWGGGPAHWRWDEVGSILSC